MLLQDLLAAFPRLDHLTLRRIMAFVQAPKLAASLANTCPAPPNLPSLDIAPLPRPANLLELCGGLLGGHEFLNLANVRHQTTAYDNAEYLKDYYGVKLGERGHAGRAADLKQLDYKQLPSFDIITAGSPCNHSAPGGSRKGVEDPTAQLAFLTVDIVVDQFKRGSLMLFLLESSGKANSKYKGGDSVFGAVLRRLQEEIGDAAEIRMMKLTGPQVGMPHGRTRQYILGGRQDAMCYQPVPDPLTIGCQDCYAYLDKQLPKTDLQDRDVLTENEERNIRAFLPKILEKITRLESEGKPVGLCSTFDVSRKQREMGGKFAASFQCQGEINSLTTKNAKNFIISNYDLKAVVENGGKVEDLDIARLMSIPERFVFIGHHGSNCRFFDKREAEIATGSAFIVTQVACALGPALEIVAASGVITSDALADQQAGKQFVQSMIAEKDLERNQKRLKLSAYLSESCDDGDVDDTGAAPSGSSH